MNVLEDNRYTQAWRALGESLPRPKAIVAISAHWYTRGTAVTAMENPKPFTTSAGSRRRCLIPAILRRVPRAGRAAAAHSGAGAGNGGSRRVGLDHGTWGVLIKMYPNADIPVVQLSVDGTQPAAYHYELGRKLAALRDEGVMIVASGNVVHNLRMVKWQGDTSAYPWAESFNNFVRDNLRYRGDNHPLVDFMRHEGAALSNPTPEHYLPLLYVLGGWDGKEAISVPIDGIEMGALSMLSVQVG